MLGRTRIKICGITRIKDALAAVNAGANAIGLVFYDKSPRAVDIDLAKAIVDKLPPFVTTVGLFVNADAAYMQQVCSQVKLGLLQFHGDETAEQCVEYSERHSLPYIKAIRVQQKTDVQQAISVYSTASGILLDTYKAGVPGGTGESFDWQLVPKNTAMPIILAGGLTPDNVATAIEQVSPYAVDVSGGVELSKGIKDTEKINAFCKAVN